MLTRPPLHRHTSRSSLKGSASERAEVCVSKPKHWPSYFEFGWDRHQNGGDGLADINTWAYGHMSLSARLASCWCHRFAFLNREDSKSIQRAANAAKYAEKAEDSKIPKGAQVRGACMHCQQSVQSPHICTFYTTANRFGFATSKMDHILQSCMRFTFSPTLPHVSLYFRISVAQKILWFEQPVRTFWDAYK